jgi:hypothetical protein
MEATPPRPTPERRAAPPEPSGWTVFASVMLVMVGSLDALWGLAAVLNDKIVTVGGEGVIVWDTTAWGWFHLILGAVLILTAYGLFNMQSWARLTAVVFATLSAILQVGVLPAFPVWALIIIALDVIVIYGLTARWEERI